MHARFALVAAAVVSTLALAGPPKRPPDDTDCKDSALFTRMPDSYIRGCKKSGFDAFDFKTGPKTTEHVEGKLERLSYYPFNDVKEKASELQILRNYENAIKTIGGAVVFSERGRSTLKLVKDGKEIWVQVGAEFTGKYGFTIVERAEMKQDVVADATAWAEGLKATGHASIYGILFDTGKAELKAESAKAIEEVAKLLKADAGLNLFVVGHTDLVGSPDANLKLSQDRAASVVQELVKKHGIAATRLSPFGAGPYSPVASNDTEDGKAKNRRVELVKR